MQKFPGDLAQCVHKVWSTFVAGNYTPPPCPPEATLRELLEAASIASAFPEEGRYPRFNLIARPNGSEYSHPVWRFEQRRPYTPGELRGLIPATDFKKSAVVVEWDEQGTLKVVGLGDFGTSWHRARLALKYQYNPPQSLLVEFPRPGRIDVYQGEFKIASLADGVLAVHENDPTLCLHSSVRGGLSDLRERICNPTHEDYREWSGFEFLALWNVYASIANLISSAGHGGALIILPQPEHEALASLRVKFRYNSKHLTNAFLGFINARHEFMDILEQLKSDTKEDGASSGLRSERGLTLERAMEEAQEDLVEKIRFTAQLANCDGALLISRDLTVVGFGTEVRAGLRPDVVIVNVGNELRRQGADLDIEAFGMRHRSAIKLVSQHPSVRVLVASQDGPISAVWADEFALALHELEDTTEWQKNLSPEDSDCPSGEAEKAPESEAVQSDETDRPRKALIQILFRKGLNLTNANLPWS